MRAILGLLALAVLVVIGLVWTGVINPVQTREARAPAISAGQTPAFDVEVNPIRVGTTTRNVQVPVVEMKTKQVEVPAIRRGSNQAEPQ